MEYKIIKSIKQLLTMNKKDNSSNKDEDYGILYDAVIIIKGDTIEWVGTKQEFEANPLNLQIKYKEYDINNRIVTPGWIDPHTHLIFAGSRHDEFGMRCSGISYEEIAKNGGGIISTVNATRNASIEELVELGKQRCKRFMSYGVTTLEAKSGYGLNYESELKILKAIKILNKSQPIEIIPTFLGAHTIPPEYKTCRNDYINLLTNKLIPKIAKENLAIFCDIFCENIAFTYEESKLIAKSAQSHGLLMRLHVDQLSSGNGALLAAELNAVSADHLDKVSDEGILALAKNNVTAILLPGATFFLGLKHYAPARKILENNVKVALSTDFNPGSCNTENLQLISTIACTHLSMSPFEAIKGVTIEAAHSLKKDNKIGVIKKGMQADIAVFDVDDYKQIPYHFGINHLWKIFKKGKEII